MAGSGLQPPQRQALRQARGAPPQRHGLADEALPAVLGVAAGATARRGFSGRPKP
jgi:hypothetical protein